MKSKALRRSAAPRQFDYFHAPCPRRVSERPAASGCNINSHTLWHARFRPTADVRGKMAGIGLMSAFG